MLGSRASRDKQTSSVSLSLPQGAATAVLQQGWVPGPAMLTLPMVDSALPARPSRPPAHPRHGHARARGTGMGPERLGLLSADDIGVILRPGGRFATQEERRGAG